jgi:hypothetical protein
VKLVELKITARHFAGVERRLFEVVGGWVPTVPETEVRLALRAQSFRHAWHAELWSSVEPAAGPTADPDTANPDADVAGPGIDPVLDALAEPPGTSERLVGLYRVVLPALFARYTAVRAAASEVSDGPLARILGLMLADDERALAWAAPFLPAAGSDHQRRLDELLDKFGGVGPPEVIE